MLGVRAGDVVARSLRISTATHASVAAVSAAVALNATVAMQFLRTPGQAIILAAVFVLLCVGLSAISVDLYSRSKQTLANLRSIGASRGKISQAVIASMVVYGAVGALLGTAAGAGIGSLGGSGAAATDVLFQSLGVLVASAGAIVAGVYAGGWAAWRS
jgi:putative ABC transport system permease protein